MTENETNSTSELIKASAEVIKTIYDDALKPVSTETGKALGTIGRTVNVALSPLRGFVWSWDQIESWLTETVTRKLEERKVSKDRIKTPDPDVAIPAIEAMRYTQLKEQYANLLATAMDSASSQEVHPSFVEILKQLTPDEAKIISFLPSHGRSAPLINLRYELPGKGEFDIYQYASTIASDAGCSVESRVPQAINNLCRLGLAEVPAMRKLAEDNRYDRIRELPLIDEIKTRIPENANLLMEHRAVGLTLMGASFRSACISR